MSASKVEVNEKQIFVRNLPFDVTSENLSELFEDIGPLKNTSVASENGVGKGFGFVKFALESDAKLAIDKLQGHVFHGRKIILELGHKKERKGRSKEAAEQVATETADVDATPAKADKADSKKDKKDKAKAKQDKSDECSVGGDSIKKSRQVLVFGIPMDINKKHFRALATKGFRKTDVDLLKEDHELSGELHITTPAGKVMLLTAPSRQEAGKITTALNNATVHSLIVALQAHHKLQVAQQQLLNKKKAAKGKAEGKESVNKVETAKDPLEGLDLTKPRKEKLFLRTAAQITPTDQRKRKCRLIIRNLSFLATEQNVLDKMSKFGPIVSVELPKKAPTERAEDSKFQGKHRRPEKENKKPAARSMGFGFVTFLCESDAQHVVDNCAGLKVCNREVAIDFCMAKETYEKFGKKQDELSAAKATTEAEGADADADGDEDTDSNESVHGSDEGSEDADELDGAEDSAGEQDGSDNDDEYSQDDEGDSEMDSNGDSNDSDGEDDASGSDDDSAPAAKAAPEKVKKEPTEDVHEGCTVFVRGLGFDAEPADLKRSLGKYGRISLALIVKDKVTDISKGTAFVKFLSADSASACVAEALLLGGISIKDRSCKIDLAVDRQSAQNIKDSEAAKRGKDKRNLYLQNEGLILPGVEGSDEHAAAHKAANMSEADKEKRMRAQTEKRKKLINPLFFVSANRLSIRNLAKTVTDKELREICVTAAKNGIKKGLVKRSDMEQYRGAQGIEYVQQQAALHGFAKAGADLDAVPPAVGKHCLKNAKIMLDMQRIRGGAPQSRGYAFAEFTHHAHALACLRELNNNAMYSSHHSNAPSAAQADPTGGKLIVEFALENIQKVKILRDREARVQKRKSDGARDSDAVPSKPDARTLKRQKAAADAKESAARSTSAPAAVEAPAKAVPVPKKPVKSYIVDPNTLPVALPEGVNPKLHNRQLEKERLKRKRQEKAAAPAAPAAPVDAASSDAPAAKKAKTEAAPVAAVKAQPAAPKQAAPQVAAKVNNSKPAAAPVIDASAAAVSGKKRKESPDSAPVSVPTPGTAVAQKPKPQAESAEPQAKKQKAATPAPAQVKNTHTVVGADASTTPAKGEPKQKKVNFEARKDNFTPTKPVSQGNKHDSKKSKQGKQAASPKGGNSPEGTPVQRPWGGHKRLRAKKAGGKK